MTEAYFAALAKKGFTAMPYADTVVLRAPLVGKEALRTIWWLPLVPALGAVKVLEQYPNELLTAITTEAEINIVNPTATLRVADGLTGNAEGLNCGTRPF